MNKTQTPNIFWLHKTLNKPFPFWTSCTDWILKPFGRCVIRTISLHSRTFSYRIGRLDDEELYGS